MSRTYDFFLPLDSGLPPIFDADLMDSPIEGSAARDYYALPYENEDYGARNGTSVSHEGSFFFEAH